MQRILHLVGFISPPLTFKIFISLSFPEQKQWRVRRPRERRFAWLAEPRPGRLRPWAGRRLRGWGWRPRPTSSTGTRPSSPWCWRPCHRWVTVKLGAKLLTRKLSLLNGKEGQELLTLQPLSIYETNDAIYYHYARWSWIRFLSSPLWVWEAKENTGPIMISLWKYK